MRTDAFGPWLTTAEAVHYTGLTRQSLHRLATAGTLPQYRIIGGRSKRFRRDDLDALMIPISAPSPADHPAPRHRTETGDHA